MKLKLQKTIISLMLALCLLVSSPLSAIAQETDPPVQEQTTDPSPQPEASPSPSTEPSPSPDPSSSPEAVPSPEPTPEPTEEELENQKYELERQQELQQAYQERDAEIQQEYQQLSNSWFEEMGLLHQNTSGGNVGDTQITTGDAAAGGVVITNANQTSVSAIPATGTSSCSACPAGDISVTNSGNGADSSSSAALNSNSTNTINIDNNATIDNNADFTADSGNNNSSFNVGDTQITTGDANVTATLITSANETGLGIAEFNVVDNHTGDIILTLPDTFSTSSCGTCASGDLTVQNTDNGAGSTNDAEANLTNTNQTTIDNNADIINDVDLIANTGLNSTSFNTAGESQITTGDANVSANLVNLVNSTVSGGVVFVVNIFGDLIGDIIFPDTIGTAGVTNTTVANTQNGAGSTNNSTLNMQNTNSTNINNFANIDNNLNIIGETGENVASFNTAGDNAIETGQVDVNADVVNVANINMTAGSSDEPVWLILVNNMGTWSGKIMGAVTGSSFASGVGLEFTVDPSGNFNIGNNDNAANSTNNATANLQNNNSLDINNNANVQNNLNIYAITGGNDASYNTGGISSIKTGDVNVAASIVNFVNTVIIGRPLMIGIINVFGSWTGNAVPPGQEKAAPAVGGADVTQPQSNNSAPQNNSQGGSSNSSGGSNSTSGQQVQQNSGSSILGSILGGFSGESASGQNQSTNTPNTPLVFGFPSGGNIGSINEALMIAVIPVLLLAWYLLRRVRNKSGRQAIVFPHSIKNPEK